MIKKLLMLNAVLQGMFQLKQARKNFQILKFWSPSTCEIVNKYQQIVKMSAQYFNFTEDIIYLLGKCAMLVKSCEKRKYDNSGQQIPLKTCSKPEHMI